MAKKIVNGEMVDVEDEKPKVEDTEIEDPKPEDDAVEEDGDDISEDGDLADDDDDEKVVEPWMQTEDDAEDSDDLGVMPVAAHVRYKRKKKAAAEQTEAELEALRKENEALKAGTFKPETVPDRPKRVDFNDEVAYYDALEQYEDKMADLRLKRQAFKKEQTQQQRQHIERVQKAVDSHYERAAKIAAETGISPEVYQETDKKVRDAVESIMPDIGDLVVDQAITLLEEGSEKVLYYLGRNQPALDRFKSLLAEDKTGMKAMIFLGQQKERLTSKRTQRSNAPAPAVNIAGSKSGANESAVIRKARKAYSAAHKKGNIQAAYDAKQAAKKAGANVSDW